MYFFLTGEPLANLLVTPHLLVGARLPSGPLPAHGGFTFIVPLMAMFNCYDIKNWWREKIVTEIK